MNFSDRISSLPPYLFAEIDKLKKKYEADGVKIIDFGIGDPDLPTPSIIIEELSRQAMFASNHKYPSYNGLQEFRYAIKEHYSAYRDVNDLSSNDEIISLIGSKEGIAHLPLAVVNPGDIVLIPNPGYPVYYSATVFAGGLPFNMPLLQENDFLPDLSKIPEHIARSASLMFLNYPNNPTSAVASMEFFKEVVSFCSFYNIILCHDASYLDIVFDAYEAPSILQIKGAKDVAIEMFSFSKTFNMTGWRLAAAVGSKDVIKALSKVKMNIDSGVFNPVQLAGIEGLRHIDDIISPTLDIYSERQKILCEALNDIGLNYHKPLGTFYVWCKIPKGKTSFEFTTELLRRIGVLVTPGTGFGNFGEGYIRFSLTLPTEDVLEAINRMKTITF